MNPVPLAGLGTSPAFLNLAGGTLRVTGAALTTNLSAALINASTLDTNGLAALWTGVLSGPGALVKTGAGTLTLAAANTYAGGTTITAGTLQLGNGATAGSIVGNVTNDGTVAFNRTDDSTFAGIISGGGGVVLAGGILRLAQAQTYTGLTQVNAGYFVLPTTVPRGLSASTLVTVASGAVLDLSNQPQTVAGLVGAGTVYSYGGNSGSLELAVATGQAQTFSGALGGAFPDFAITKSGLGTLTLAGANTYTGPTTVTAGTLRVNGSLATTPVAVASGATLGGVGTLGGLATFAAGAHLAPGNSPGTITFNAGLVLQSGSLLDFELGTASDQIALTGGSLTGPGMTGGVTLNLSDSGGFAPGTYTLINYTSATLPTAYAADSFALGTTIPGYTYNLALSGNSLQLTASAIPEPATYAALLGAAALALAAYRRRQKK